jgi:hypothetical protein
MLFVGLNIFMCCSACLFFDLQWAPNLDKNSGVVTSPWTHHQSWWTSIPDRTTDRLTISDQTKLINFIFYRRVASSSYLTSFSTDVMGLMMCSIWKDHPMTSIFILYTLVSCRWVTELPQSNKNPSHLVLIGHDFHPLVLSDNLNMHGANWMYLLQA